MLLPNVQFFEEKGEDGEQRNNLKKNTINLYFEEEIKIPEYKWICKSFKDEFLNENNEIVDTDFKSQYSPNSIYTNEDSIDNNICEKDINPFEKELWCKCKKIPMDHNYKCIDCLTQYNDQCISDEFYVPELCFAIDATGEFEIEMHDSIVNLQHNILNGSINSITIKNLSILFYFQNTPLELNYNNEFILNKQNNQSSLYIDNIKNNYELQKENDKHIFFIETDFDLSFDFYQNEDNNKCIQFVFEGSVWVSEGENNFRFQICKSINGEVEEQNINDIIEHEYRETIIDDNTTLTSNF